MSGQVEWPEAGMFQPYDVVRDTVSDFTGKITGEFKYANGCVRYELSGKDHKDVPTGYVFDREQLVLVERAEPMEQPKPSGGSRSQTPPPRR